MRPLTSCCCFNLRTGGLIIGWLGIIGGVFELSDIFVLSSGAKNQHKTVGYAAELDEYTSGNPVGSALVTVFYIVLEALWVYGVNENKESLMMPSLAMSMIGCVCGMIAVVIGVAVLIFVPALFFSDTDAKDRSMIVAIIFMVVVLFLIFMALTCYFTAVKYYLYKQIQRENQGLPPIVEFNPTTNGVVYKLPA